MSIKAGDLVHVGGGDVLVDRLQTGGPGSLNIPTERITELGNYKGLGVVRDIADLSFNFESLDASAEMEAMFVGSDFATDGAGTEYDITLARTLDVASQFKDGADAASPYDVVMSAAVPYLTLESLSYRFGTGQNAQQTATLRGDSLFYAAASAYMQEEVGTASAGQTIQLTNDPIVYEGDTVNGDRYALSVVIVETGERLAFGTDYTEAIDTPAAGNLTITITDAVPVTNTIRVMYQSLTVASYPQVSHAAVSATRPAAIRGKDIEIRVGGVAVTDRWSSVQNVNVDWRVQLDRDEELGNQQVVSQDFELPDCTGSVEIRPRNALEMITRIKQIAGVTGDKVVGPLQVATLPMDIILHSPVDGQILKTIYVEDAEFTLPGFSGRVLQKMPITLDWTSVTGDLKVYKGARP